MEPNFGCCTANMHQGWPKLVQSLWMASRDGGLVAVVYAPNEVRTVAGGVPVTITEDTEYPFRDTITFTIESRAARGVPAHAPRAGMGRRGDAIAERVEGAHGAAWRAHDRGR